MNAQPYVVMNGNVKHCPLKLMTGEESLARIYSDCHYSSVCPTPCSPLERLAMQIDAEVKR